MNDNLCIFTYTMEKSIEQRSEYPKSVKRIDESRLSW